MLMDIPFHSEEAKEVNKMIFETIYHAALEKSNELAKSKCIEILDFLSVKDQLSDIHKYKNKFIAKEYAMGLFQRFNLSLLGAYSTFEGSPSAKGILQYDFWSITPSTRYNWKKLKASIQEHGLRNSLLIAPMPTASTSQILGFNECFEPITSNIYSRRTMAGDFVIINKHLMKELNDIGIWDEELKNNIISNKGSIQQLANIPEHIRNKYKIAWEIPMKHVIDMAIDRGPFICQSQSLNLWVENPQYNKLTSMHFYAWENGLKTGIYYLRSKAKYQPQQFTIEPKSEGDNNNEICEMCTA
jgi:ribonucleotide reductase alpha subunit